MESTKMKKVEKCRVLYKTYLTKDVVQIFMENSAIANEAMPGQFLNIKCGNDGSMILRRPMSICKTTRSKNIFAIAFRIVGKGTRLLAEVDRGDTLDIIGPLGNGFDLNVKENEKIAIVAGGMGVMPVLFLAKRFKDYNVDSYLGFKSADELMLEDDYRRYSKNLFISTDDGSKGYKGFVTDLLKKQLIFKNYDKIYACGPSIMFKNLKNVLASSETANTICQVSLEEHMGCGIGACLVCSCKIKTSDADGGFDYKRVCKDGPVFDIREVIFE